MHLNTEVLLPHFEEIAPTVSTTWSEPHCSSECNAASPSLLTAVCLRLEDLRRHCSLFHCLYLESYRAVGAPGGADSQFYEKNWERKSFQNKFQFSNRLGMDSVSKSPSLSHFRSSEDVTQVIHFLPKIQCLMSHVYCRQRETFPLLVTR